MNNQADTLQSQVVLLRMQGKSTEELQAIWQENDRSNWSKEDFDAVQKVLIERVGKTPEQQKVDKYDETFIFKNNGVTITYSDVIINGESYKASDITEAKIISQIPHINTILGGIATIVSIFILLVSCVFSINFDLVVKSIPIILLIGGGAYLFTKSNPSTYLIQITNRSKNVSIYQSNDLPLIEKIVAAINKAISNKK